jgi:uncharacterized membrane protein YphA (DoxX/SURF4 family)
MKRSAIAEIIALGFVTLFLYTGISKLIDYTTFKEQIALSPILQPIAPFMAWILPLVEIVVAIQLFIPSWRLKGLYASFALMIIFTIYVGILLLTNVHLPCSCGGIIALLSWKQHLLVNSICVGLVLFGISLERKSKKNIYSISKLIYN